MKWDTEQNIHTETVEEFFNENEIKEVKNKMFSHIVTIIIASLSLISALAWEEALHGLYEFYFKNSDSILGKFGYATLVTFIAIIVSIVVGKRYFKKVIKK